MWRPSGQFNRRYYIHQFAGSNAKVLSQFSFTFATLNCQLWSAQCRYTQYEYCIVTTVFDCNFLKFKSTKKNSFSYCTLPIPLKFAVVSTARQDFINICHYFIYDP